MEPDKDPFYIWGSWSQNITSPLIMEFETPGKIRKLALGHSFAIMIDYKDKLWSWGYNPEGCLGLGEERRQSKVPEYVSMPHGDDLTF